MVEDLRVDPPALGPWRSDNERYPETQAYRAVQRRIRPAGADFFLLCRDVFVTCVYTCCYGDCVRPCRVRWNIGRDVVEIPVVFIVRQDENGFLPDFRVLGQNIQGFGDVPSTVPESTGVVGEIAGSHQPGDGWKTAFFNIFAELMEYIALGYLYALITFCIGIPDGFQLMVVGISGIGDKGSPVDFLFLFRQGFEIVGSVPLQVGTDPFQLRTFLFKSLPIRIAAIQFSGQLLCPLFHMNPVS